jgi:hypothetical protein
MTFSKSFARNMPGSNYPIWEEIFLTSEEEKSVEEQCRKENMLLMDECLREAKGLVIKNGINSDENIIGVAVSLFEKRASHVIFWKESKAKDKFEEKFGMK